MESKVDLTFCGGINEVGGNALLLEDHIHNVKLFIDFGINIKSYNNHYEYLQFPKSVEELIRLGLLPDEAEIGFLNLYQRESVKIKYNPSNASSKLDAIIISHPHRDHFLALSFINRNIPVYAGEFTQKIISAYYKCTKRSIINNFEGIKWKLFRTGDIIHINGLEIIPCHVDHSIPASYGFIIKTSAGNCVYTGDFRMHGPLSWMSYDFVKKIKEYKVNTLICEGTHVNQGHFESEKKVKRNLKQLFKQMPYDYALVKYDRLNWDRFRTYSVIAKMNDFNYIISEKDAYFYYLMNKDKIYESMRHPNILNDDHILIITNGDVRFKWQETIRTKLYKEGKGSRLLKTKDISNLNKKFLLYLTRLPIKLIEKLNKKFKGVFISSYLDPYTEEYVDDNHSISRKLMQLGIPSYQIHASGHIMPHDLYKFIINVNPTTLIPIHTEYPHFFESLLENSEIKVLIPEKYRKIQLN